MVLDYVGTKLLPNNWEMWKTSIRWQAVAKFATEENKDSYTLMHKTRKAALREVKRLLK